MSWELFAAFCEYWLLCHYWLLVATRAVASSHTRKLSGVYGHVLRKVILLYLYGKYASENMPKFRGKDTATSRFWCFTDYQNVITEDYFASRPVTFSQWQLERCPTTGSLHYQGYVVFTRAYSERRVRDLFPRSHVERCKGTHEENLVYTSKEDTRVEGPYIYGDDTGIGQGTRSDMVRAVADIHSCRTIREFISKHAITYVRYHRGLERLR